VSATRIASPELPELPAEAFTKHDPSPDSRFYREPRFVTHIDEPRPTWFEVVRRA
jgi:hypothetical protein